MKKKGNFDVSFPEKLLPELQLLPQRPLKMKTLRLRPHPCRGPWMRPLRPPHERGRTSLPIGPWGCMLTEDRIELAFVVLHDD